MRTLKNCFLYQGKRWLRRQNSCEDASYVNAEKPPPTAKLARLMPNARRPRVAKVGEEETLSISLYFSFLLLLLLSFYHQVARYSKLSSPST